MLTQRNEPVLMPTEKKIRIFCDGKGGGWVGVQLEVPA